MLEFFRESGAERDNWSFGKHNIPIRPQTYQFLEPPEHLQSTVKKVWKDRGYGLWPYKSIYDFLKDVKLDYELTKEQRNLYKSHIATLLIADDAKNFDRLDEKNHFRVAFYELAKDNTKRLSDRREKVAMDIVRRTDPVTGTEIFASVEEFTKSRVLSFVQACRRTKGDPKVISSLIDQQVFLFLRDMNSVNKCLPQTSGIMGLESFSKQGSV